MYYSVCASAVFSGMSLIDALGKIRESGAKVYEFWGLGDQDVDRLAEAQKESGLRLAAMCTKGFVLNDPARRGEYLEGLKETIPAAKKLGCSTLISQVGQAIEGVSREAQHASIVEGLRACAPILEAAGMPLVIEPLNVLVNHPGYYLTTSAEGYEIVREVNSPNVRLLFDVYHQQITEGNLIANINAGAELIGHIHVAGNPGRHELTLENEIHYPSVFAALKRLGYDKAIGLEYFPTGDPAASLRALFKAIPIE